MKDAAALRVSHCPTCGGKRIRRVTRDVSGTFRGQEYLARKVTFEQCPDCGEQLFDHAAMEKLRAARAQARVTGPAHGARPSSGKVWRPKPRAVARH